MRIMEPVTPSPKGELDPADKERLTAALDARLNADAGLRAAVQSAAKNGASVRELAAYTGLSTNTISRWKRDL